MKHQIPFQLIHLNVIIKLRFKSTQMSFKITVMRIWILQMRYFRISPFNISLNYNSYWKFHKNKLIISLFKLLIITSSFIQIINNSKIINLKATLLTTIFRSILNKALLRKLIWINNHLIRNLIHRFFAFKWKLNLITSEIIYN